MTSNARFAPGRIQFGGDWNPEQWPAAIRAEDVELMQRAGVTMATLGVFSWGELEPEPGRFEFDGMDDAIDRLHAAGIAVDLATPTASPPIWLHRAHPEILPVSRTGQRYEQGGRLGWCPSSPVFREAALGVVDAIAHRYGAHPAVRLWHLGNEFGGGNRRCYCDVSAAAFSRWLADRYGAIEALNAAWGTAFWGHRYRAFDEVEPPRDSETVGLGNPGLVLDFDRFSSWALLQHAIAERDVVRRHSPGIPITTNSMVGVGPHVVDYAGWAREFDLVANDHYVTAADPHREADVAYAADRTRGLDPSRPWLLMETAAGAVSWQRVNRPPEPGAMRRTAMTHIARGADGVMFFQWRQSIAGAEQFHSAVVPHAGAGSRTFREVEALGAELALLAPVAGTLVDPARIAILVDDESGWAWDSGPKPVWHRSIATEAARWHRLLGAAGHRVDVLPVSADLGMVDVVLVPALFLMSATTAGSLATVVARGGTVVVSSLSGIVDETNTVVPGGYPGFLRDLLGIRVIEHVPLLADDAVALGSGAVVDGWAELLEAPSDGGAEVVDRYAQGGTCAIVAGHPAVTARDVGAGRAWYCSASLDDPGLLALLQRVLEHAGVPADGVQGLDVVRRAGGGRAFRFAINHGAAPVELPIGGTDLLTGDRHQTTTTVPPGGVVVIEETA